MPQVADVSQSAKIAEEFIGLSRARARQWPLERGPGAVAHEDQKILLSTVRAAGFECSLIGAGAIVRGSLAINSKCPYRLLDLEGAEDIPATGWLDQLHTLVSQRHAMIPVEEMVDVVVREMQRSIPLAPIRLTRDGVFMVESLPPIDIQQGRYFVEHKRDACKLGTPDVGLHKRCKGIFDRHAYSDVLDTLVCRKCGTRAKLPRNIETYGDLRTLMVRKLVSEGED